MNTLTSSKEPKYFHDSKNLQPSTFANKSLYGVLISPKLTLYFSFSTRNLPSLKPIFVSKLSLLLRPNYIHSKAADTKYCLANFLLHLFFKKIKNKNSDFFY